MKLTLTRQTGQKLRKFVHFHLENVFATESVSPYQLCTHVYQGLLTFLQLVRVITETRKSLHNTIPVNIATIR